MLYRCICSGDYSPETNGGRLFTAFYILLGFGVVLSMAGSLYVLSSLPAIYMVFDLDLIYVLVRAYLRVWLKRLALRA